MTDRKPRVPFEIDLQNGMKAIVDAEDYSALQGFKWYAYRNRNAWYVRRTEDGRQISMHRQILNAPSGIQVDHVNRNGLDNRRENLRLCTHSQNRANGRTSSSTGFRGVTKTIRKMVTKSYPRWNAAVRFKGKVKLLGSFRDPISAAKAYDKAAKQLHGEFATLNFPEDK